MFLLPSWSLQHLQPPASNLRSTKSTSSHFPLSSILRYKSLQAPTSHLLLFWGIRVYKSLIPSWSLQGLKAPASTIWSTKPYWSEGQSEALPSCQAATVGTLTKAFNPQPISCSLSICKLLWRKASAKWGKRKSLNHSLVELTKKHLQRLPCWKIQLGLTSYWFHTAARDY